LWFEVDRTRKGQGGMLASLLGSGKLKRELTIPATTKPDQVGELVLNYLDQTTAVHES
ncbi:sporulation control protein Spo0M, partial [Vibrio alginolyticus]